MTANNHMSPRDWFGVGLRLFAFIPLMKAFDSMIIYVDYVTGFSSGYYISATNSSSAMLFMNAAAYIVFAAFLIFFAPAITDFAYSGQQNEAEIPETDVNLPNEPDDQ